MHESAATREPPDRLSYPFSTTPEIGSALEVADGVLWIRLPLPFRLNHINVWALRDGDGWVIVDTGIRSAEITAAWQQVFAGPMGGRPVKQVVCTHMHPDHMGMAGWLTRRFQCRFSSTRLEYLTCRVLVADTGREAPEDALQFYRAAGWDDESIEYYKAHFGNFGQAIYMLPDSYHRVSDGEVLTIGGRDWHAVVGRGHSPEHLCLYCPELRVLISGDQVLPKISSNVSVFPTEPEADPLSEWLSSLADVKRRVPNDVLVLPSHNEPFQGLHARLDRLIKGHEQSLIRLLDALQDPRRAVDVFKLLFGRQLHGELLSFATGESVAHLNCLMRRGSVVREADAAGQLWYRRR